MSDESQPCKVLKAAMAGLTIFVHELEGVISIKHARLGKPLQRYELRNLEWENNDNVIQGLDAENLPAGVNVQATGVRLKLTRNDGDLDLIYEARDGCSSHWRFLGLAVSNTTPNIPPAESQGTDTCEDASSIAAPLAGSSPGHADQKAEAGGADESTRDKRKSRDDDIEASSKRLKSQTGQAKPGGHLFLHCHRRSGSKSRQAGLLHIDIDNSRAWFVWEGNRKQIDLIDPETIVKFAPLPRRQSCGLTHALEILGQDSVARQSHRFYAFIRLKSGDETLMWKQPTLSNDAPRTIIQHPIIIVHALVHAVDVESKRTTVYYPEKDGLLRHSIDRLIETQRSRTLFTIERSDLEDYKERLQQYRMRLGKYCECRIESMTERSRLNTALATAEDTGSAADVQRTGITKPTKQDDRTSTCPGRTTSARPTEKKQHRALTSWSTTPLEKRSIESKVKNGRRLRKQTDHPNYVDHVRYLDDGGDETYADA